MTPFRVEFTRQADADFDDIADFIARDNPLKAISFVDELQQRAAAILSGTPYAGRREGDHRVLVLGRYVAAYVVEEEARLVRVVLIAEGHRNWRLALSERR